MARILTSRKPRRSKFEKLPMPTLSADITLVLCAVVLCFPVNAEDDPLPPGASVTISSALPRGTAEEPVFELKLSYGFDKRSTVWLQGVGAVPASGELRYTLRGASVVFTEDKGGPTLASVLVAPTEIRQTPPQGNPYASTAAGWLLDGARIVAPVPIERAWNFLEQSLRDTYGVYVAPTPCRPDDSGCLLTQWTTITRPSDWTQAQMAVMIVYADDASKQSSLKVYYIARQAPVGDKVNWDDKIDEQTRALVTAKVSALRTRLSSWGSGK
jgi:hypothetical protein